MTNDLLVSRRDSPSCLASALDAAASDILSTTRTYACAILLRQARTAGLRLASSWRCSTIRC